MAYTLLCEEADAWVDKAKVRFRVEELLSQAGGTEVNDGPHARAAETAMLMLAGGSSS